ncbi:chymotrypsin-2-like [Nasonia vitripennis]|uniref:Peptidase S1 domain-containing protein n=1 Tax=Nasonia vitripennis TaxID=7425 RepID=A0A7M7QNF1_NASVI|nr:chymotrypsin-2-like [Nasonia vitripennis]
MYVVTLTPLHELLEVLKLRMGDNGSQIYQVEYRTYHRRWSVPAIINDIALIRVDRDIEFSSKVQPIALTSYDISETGTSAVLSGWGMTNYNNSRLPDNLQ